jgi:hypothetical protein
MKSKRCFLFVASIALTFVTCRNDAIKPHAPPPSTKLDGVYNVVSIVCDYPIDLDRDGAISKDVLAETHEAVNASRYYIELKTEIYHWDPDFYDQQIDVWIPFTHVFRDEKGNFLDVQYSFTNLLATYRYDEATGLMSIRGNLGNGEVIGGRLISKDTLLVQFKAYFYSTKGWETLPLTGIYKRRP